MTSYSEKMLLVAALASGAVACADVPTDGPSQGGSGAEFSVAPNAAAWTIVAPMHTSRSLHAVTTFINPAGHPIVYVIGGQSGPEGRQTGVVEAYDPSSDTWTRRANMPIARYGTAGAVVIGKKIYVTGGWERLFALPFSDLFEYTPGTNKWRRLNGPANIGFALSGAIGGRLYVTGGQDGSDIVPNLYRYDPDTRGWDTLPPSPLAHSCGGGAVLNGQFHVVGGTSEFGSTTTHHVYDPATNAWTTKAPIPNLVSCPGSAVVDGKLYLISPHQVDIYDPTSDSWSQGIPMPTPRSDVGAAAVTTAGHTVIYVSGGHTTPFKTFFRTERYDPSVP